MATLNDKIAAKIRKFNFSDGSSAESRASAIVIKNNDIGFSLDIGSINIDEAENVRLQIIQSLQEISGIGKISIVLTKSSMVSAPGKNKVIIDGVKKVIVVAAGKGGVGKSTIASLIAHKLSKDGAKVGILDADIYGPSIPKIFNLEQEKPKLEDNKILPLEKYGIKVNSIGFVVPNDQSVTMRGPMSSKALYQLLSLTKWGNLDYLIIDTPPGTGDIHISLLQNYVVDGALLVTMPQKISAIDVSRTINLYRKFGVSIIGLIENMSYFTDPVTGKSVEIFSGNSGEDMSEKYQIQLLAKVPIIPDLSALCDLGGDFSQYSYLLKKLNI